MQGDDEKFHGDAPNSLTLAQFEALIADSYLAGVEARYLEWVRKDHAQVTQARAPASV